MILCAVVLSTAAFSQTETAASEEVKFEREVKVTEVNGVKTLEVTTINKENGEIRFEKFTGVAAEMQLAEMEKEEAKLNSQGKRVIVRKKIENEEKAVEFTPTKPSELNKSH